MARHITNSTCSCQTHNDTGQHTSPVQAGPSPHKSHQTLDTQSNDLRPQAWRNKALHRIDEAPAQWADDEVFSDDEYAPSVLPMTPPLSAPATPEREKCDYSQFRDEEGSVTVSFTRKVMVDGSAQTTDPEENGHSVAYEVEVQVITHDPYVLPEYEMEQASMAPMATCELYFNQWESQEPMRDGSYEQQQRVPHCRPKRRPTAPYAMLNPFGQPYFPHNYWENMYHMQNAPWQGSERAHPNNVPFHQQCSPWYGCESATCNTEMGQMRGAMQNGTFASHQESQDAPSQLSEILLTADPSMPLRRRKRTARLQKSQA